VAFRVGWNRREGGLARGAAWSVGRKWHVTSHSFPRVQARASRPRTAERLDYAPGEHVVDLAVKQRLNAGQNEPMAACQQSEEIPPIPT
jgi:hypothetical protein